MEWLPWIMAILIFAIVFFILYRPKGCKHEIVICLHDDEAIDKRGRGQCAQCERVFKELPEECVYTGRPHGVDMTQ